MRQGLFALALIVAPAVSAQSPGEVFSSGAGARPSTQCRAAYAACAAARQAERTTHPGYRAAAAACRADLDEALAREAALNGQLEHLKTLRGRARSAYYASTVEPTNEARGDALRDYRRCVAKAAAAGDLRPDDYGPRSPLLLHGWVANDEPPPGTPDGDAWRSTLRDTLRRMNGALYPAAEPLKNLASVLDAIAPHYDMVSRSDTGLRVIRDIFVDMGVGHLGGRAAAGLQRLAGRADDAARVVAGAGRALDPAGAPASVGRRAGPGERAFGHPAGHASELPGLRMGATGYNLPPGMRLPAVVANTPRPVHLQRDTHSCVLACVRMVSDTVLRTPVSEARLGGLVRGPAGYQPGVGTEGEAMAEMLGRIGVNNGGWGEATVAELAERVRTGYPAITTFGSRHVAVVDAVVEHGGEQWVLLRNPANPAHWDARTAELFEGTGFGNYVALARRDFAELFEAGGARAVFSRP